MEREFSDESTRRTAAQFLIFFGDMSFLKTKFSIIYAYRA